MSKLETVPDLIMFHHFELFETLFHLSISSLFLFFLFFSITRKPNKPGPEKAITSALLNETFFDTYTTINSAPRVKTRLPCRAARLCWEAAHSGAEFGFTAVLQAGLHCKAPNIKVEECTPEVRNVILVYFV